jgi:hypothetical protein
MKKLLTLMIMLGVFLIPRYTTQAALTPPASYDYSFTYNATDGEFQFSDGVDTYTPEFTRTADGIYFNYTYTGDAEGLLPFEVTLTFNRSNTSWTFGTTGYIATDTKIGSNNGVGTVINKFYVEINNLTNIDYHKYLDISSTAQGVLTHFWKYNNIQSGRVAFTSFLWESYLPSYINYETFSTSTSIAVYLDAFYLKDLGQSDSYTAGVESTTAFQEGYEVGFGFGYQAGVEEDNAYALGYARGLSEGADMETGSSIIILVVGAIGFIMMIFGFTTKRRIFNLLSVGAFIVLGGLLAQYVGFIIITIGLVIVNVYYTFWGEI